MRKLPPARFLFPINQSNFSQFRHRHEKWRNCPRRDFCFRSISEISVHSDTVAKNDEIAPGAIFVSDQPAKFWPIPTPSRKMTKYPRLDFCLRLICQILARSDTVAKNDEIAPGAIFVSDQTVKSWPIQTPSRKIPKLPPARFLYPINQSNFSPFRHRHEKWQNFPRLDFCFRSISQILAHSDTVAKNGEFAPGAIFVFDQSVKF
jgi:hypothetical protein